VPERRNNASFRFDSPPKEDEVIRDNIGPMNSLAAMMPGLQQAMGVLNPSAMNVPAGPLPGSLQQQLGLPAGTSAPLPLPARGPIVEEQRRRMIKVSNVPPQITNTQLETFLNQVAIAMKVPEIPGDPIRSVEITRDTLTAMVEFRTAGEATAAEKLNGVELMNNKMKIEKPNFEEPTPLNATLPGIRGATAIPGAPPGFGGSVPSGGNVPTLGDMMVTHKERESCYTPLPAPVDLKLALVNIPRFVQERAISDLLNTFGSLKFYRLLSREEVTDENESVVFFEYFDLNVQNTARKALQGLDLGSGKQKLSVMTSDEVMASGKLVRKQQVSNRIVPSRVLYLSSLVQPEELYDDTEFDEIYNDVYLECENFGAMTSLTIPRPHPGTKILREMARKKKEREEQEFKERQDRIIRGEVQLALADGNDEKEKAKMEDKQDDEDCLPDDEDKPTDPPGVGYAFAEFSTVEGASKAKKALTGRRFGSNEVVAEYFSEDLYAKRDFQDIKPNRVLPKVVNADPDEPEEEIEFIW